MFYLYPRQHPTTYSYHKYSIGRKFVPFRLLWTCVYENLQPLNLCRCFLPLIANSECHDRASSWFWCACSSMAWKSLGCMSRRKIFRSFPPENIIIEVVILWRSKYSKLENETWNVKVEGHNANMSTCIYIKVFLLYYESKIWVVQKINYIFGSEILGNSPSEDVCVK